MLRPESFVLKSEKVTLLKPVTQRLSNTHEKCLLTSIYDSCIIIVTGAKREHLATSVYRTGNPLAGIRVNGKTDA